MTTEQDRATVTARVEQIPDGRWVFIRPTPEGSRVTTYCATGDEGEAEAQELFDFWNEGRSYADRLAQVQQVPEPDNQWIGDVMILTALMDSDCVNEQEREVLARWIAAPASPGEAAQTTQGGWSKS